MSIFAGRRHDWDLSPAELADEARAWGLDPAAIAPGDLLAAVQGAKARAWREENAEAIAQREAWYEEHGHPLAAYVDPDHPLRPYLEPGPHWRRE
jgi:post-segregation antitoxin (ccd killing protein)